MNDWIRDTWTGHATFRDAVRTLLRTGPAEIQVRYPGAFEDALFVPQSAEDVQVHGVLTWLSQNLDSFNSSQELIESLSVLISEESPELVEEFRAIRPELDRLFNESEADRFQRIASRLEHSIVPNLVEATTALDLRVHRTSLRSDVETTLVPVTLLRLTFDEPVGGARSIAVQMSARVLSRFIDELQSAQSDIATATKEIQEDGVRVFEGTEKDER